MAYGNFVLDKGYDASAALTKFRVVKYTGTAEEVGPVTAITDEMAGVGQFTVTSDDLTAGKGASVRLLGISEVEAGGAIAVGAMCQLEADGTVTAVVASSGKRIVGKCVGSAAAADGDRIAMMLIHGLGVA